MSERRKYDPRAMWQEWRTAERANERALQLYDKLRAEMVSVDFDPISGEASDEYSPENHAHSYSSYITSQLVSGNPRVRIRASALSPGDPLNLEILGGEAATNQWLIDADFRQTMEDLATPSTFAFSAAYVSRTRNPYSYSPDPSPYGWPSVEYISPRNFFRDPLALLFRQCDYLGHRWIMQREDLITEAEENPDDGWDIDTIRGLTEAGSGAKSRPQDYERGYTAGRGEVELIELHFRNYELEEGNEWGAEPSKGADDGDHGTIFTLAVSSPAARESGGKRGVIFPRKPRAYTGHRSGPYAHMGVWSVPDSPYFLAPLVATYGQAKDVNETAKAIARAMRAYKRLTLVANDDPTIADKLESGHFDSVVPVKGIGIEDIRKLVAMVETGGSPPEAVAYSAMKLQSLWRNQGMGSAQTGNADPTGTATGTAIATQESNVRTDHHKEAFWRFIESIIRKVSCHIMTSDEVEIALDWKSSAALAQAAGLPMDSRPNGYSGGMTFKQFEQTTLELDVTSVQRVTEERVQARLMNAHQMFLASAPFIAQTPGAAQFWIEHFNKLGDALNVPHFGEHIGLFIQGVMAQGGLPQPQPDSTQPTPHATAAQGPRQRPTAQATPKQSPTGNHTPGLKGGAQNPVKLPSMQRMSA